MPTTRCTLAAPPPPPPPPSLLPTPSLSHKWRRLESASTVRPHPSGAHPRRPPLSRRVHFVLPASLPAMSPAFRCVASSRPLRRPAQHTPRLSYCSLALVEADSAFYTRPAGSTAQGLRHGRDDRRDAFVCIFSFFYRRARKVAIVRHPVFHELIFHYSTLPLQHLHCAVSSPGHHTQPAIHPSPKAAPDIASTPQLQSHLTSKNKKATRALSNARALSLSTSPRTASKQHDKQPTRCANDCEPTGVRASVKRDLHGLAGERRSSCNRVVRGASGRTADAPHSTARVRM